MAHEDARQFQFAPLGESTKFFGLPIPAVVVIGVGGILSLLLAVSFGGSGGVVVFVGGATITGCASAATVAKVSVVRRFNVAIRRMITRDARHVAGRRRAESSPVKVASHRRSRGTKELGFDLQLQRSSVGGPAIVVSRHHMMSGFLLPDTNPWMASREELDRQTASWSSALAMCARDLPKDTELLWRVDVVPLSETTHRGGTFDGHDETLLDLRADIGSRAWVTIPTLWVLRRRGSLGGGDHGSKARVAAMARSVSEALIRSGCGAPTEIAYGDLLEVCKTPLLRGVGGGGPTRWSVKASDLRPDWDEIRVGPNYGLGLRLSSWPTRPVGAGFALSLFRPVAPRRTLYMTLAPIADSRAMRQAQRRRSEAMANAHMRRRAGYMERAKDLRDDRQLHRQEEELAAGHALLSYDLRGVIWGPSRLEIRRGLESFEVMASESQLSMAIAYGRQLETLVGSLGFRDLRVH